MTLAEEATATIQALIDYMATNAKAAAIRRYTASVDSGCTNWTPRELRNLAESAMRDQL